MLIAGLVAEVDMALGHDDVRALATQKAAERGPRDSRRLALAKEGQIAEGSPAWEDMPAGDRAKRKRAAGALGWCGVGEELRTGLLLPACKQQLCCGRSARVPASAVPASRCSGPDPSPPSLPRPSCPPMQKRRS